MLRSIVVGLIAIVGVSVCAPSQAQVRSKQTTYAFIRCESINSRESFCPADTRRGVAIVNQVSNSGCVLGETWGYTSAGIWVSQGCRGEFEIGRAGNNYGYGYGFSNDTTVVCASEDYRREFCPVDTRMGVRLVNQISRSPCVQNRTWWREDRGIVVTEGCAAEFEINYRNNPYSNPGRVESGGGYYQPDVLRCESIEGRYRHCPADVRYGEVQLVRQISSTRCIPGTNWGFDHRGVWVTQGCRGEFQIVYRQQPDPHHNNNIVRCESNDSRLARCSIGGANYVTLSRQLSRTQCIEGHNWGYDRDGLWVSQGCRAEFQVENRRR